MKTVVLGSGGWGTALSLVLHRNGHPVTLWSHVPEKAAYMERARENPRLEGVPLPPELRLTADMGCLTEAELALLPPGAKTMTMECGVRFLTDYLDGDHYFRIHREGHNLDRCRTQLTLVKDMQEKLPQMNEIIKKYK